MQGVRHMLWYYIWGQVASACDVQTALGISMIYVAASFDTLVRCEALLYGL